MKAVGYFRSISPTVLAPVKRDAVVKRLVENAGGWSAVAVGSGGNTGVGLKAAKEEDAVAAALTDCARQDNACRVIAIGPFSVEPN
jgi:adenylate cyclase